MLFLLITSILNFSYAKDYVNSRFTPLKFFGSQPHVQKILETESSLTELEQKLTSFYETFYEYSNTQSNVISTTKFKRPDIYLSINFAIARHLDALNEGISSLLNNSHLRLQSLEIYSLPNLSQLPSAEKNSIHR